MEHYFLLEKTMATMELPETVEADMEKQMCLLNPRGK